jgi:outer membrane protein assembly factor BamB
MKAARTICLFVTSLVLCGCVQMEWRGGMIPHVGLKNAKPAPQQINLSHSKKWRTGDLNWPQFRGPKRDGHSPDQGTIIHWENTPTLVWEDTCGAGHSSIITSTSLIYTLEQIGDEETLTARFCESGKLAWQYKEKTKWEDMMSGPGPRSTPTLHKNQLIALFSNGTLVNLDPQTGEKHWEASTLPEDHHFPEWGISCSPLIWKNKIILSLGGEVGAAQAYDLKSGRSIWRGESFERGTYLSPTILNLLDEDHLIVAVEGSILGLDPETGIKKWEQPWKIFLNNAQIAQPLLIAEDTFLISAGYGKGAECLQIRKDGDGYNFSTLWKSKDLKTKFSNSILHDGSIYGFSENLLVCVDAKTGDLNWRGKKYGYGRILLASDKLVLLGNTGELTVVNATPDSFQEIYSGQLLGNARCWNGPALVNGYLFARNGEQIACFDWAN